MLIWLVQIIIYPSFYYYSESKLKLWHSIYTRKITYFVMPLMLAQLGLYTWVSFMRSAWLDFLSLGLLLITWGVTFLVSIPWHRHIDERENTMPARQQLTYTNWARTAMWSIILFISLYQYGK